MVKLYRRELVLIFILALFVFIGFLDYKIIGFDPILLPHDNDTGLLSLGLGWYSLNPFYPFSHPAPNVSQVSALLSVASSPLGDDTALWTFNNLGRGLNFIFLGAVLVWTSFLAKSIDLSFRQLVLSFFLLLSFPTSVLYIAHFSDYFWICCLSVPVGISLYGLIKYNKLVLSLSVGLGLCVGTFWIFSPLLLIPLVVIYSREDFSHLKSAWLLTKKQQNIIAVQIGFWAACLGCTVAIYKGIWTPAAFVIGALLAPVGYYGAVKISIFLIRSETSYRFWLGYISAFTVSTNVFSGVWFLTVYTAVKDSAGSAVGAEPYVSPWLIVSLLVICFGILKLVERVFFENEMRSNLTISIWVFVLIMLVALLPMIWEPSSPLYPSGLSVRFSVIILPLLIAILCLSLESARAQNGFIAIFLIVGAISATESFIATKDKVEENAALGNEVNVVLDDFLTETPNGVILCLRDELFSRYCGTAYAYNRYRTQSSRDAFKTNRLFDGKVAWIYSGDELPDTLSDLSKSAVLLAGETDRIEKINKELLSKGSLLFDNKGRQAILFAPSVNALSTEPTLPSP